MHFTQFVSFPPATTPKGFAESRSHDNESEASRLHDITILVPRDAVNQATQSAAFLSHTFCHNKKTCPFALQGSSPHDGDPSASPLHTARWQNVWHETINRAKTIYLGFPPRKQKLKSARLHWLNPRSTNLHNGREKATILPVLPLPWRFNTYEY